ncbi:hypothetical protein P171DRAFT_484042 [Karstenula rhodostoma CBS 690.94]|uniref:Uncharacterized protein n=1 Tax=Karstenula rhodostoma CBS 690.94 TaxID=1392251 RepID=A0A9P4PM05_9PLEO|nr:hypothetical protein P171DRAFT_484042 [Karstenula rhodostoma CBS 690.94]
MAAGEQQGPSGSQGGSQALDVGWARDCLIWACQPRPETINCNVLFASGIRLAQSHFVIAGCTQPGKNPQRPAGPRSPCRMGVRMRMRMRMMLALVLVLVLVVLVLVALVLALVTTTGRRETGRRVAALGHDSRQQTADGRRHTAHSTAHSTQRTACSTPKSEHRRGEGEAPAPAPGALADAG